MFFAAEENGEAFGSTPELAPDFWFEAAPFLEGEGDFGIGESDGSSGLVRGGVLDMPP